MRDFRSLYNREGAYHQRAAGFRSWFLQDNYKAIARACGESAAALDLACGEGCLSAYLSPGRLVGVDYSSEALRLNQSILPGAYDELLIGDLRDLDSLDLPKQNFDLAVCSLTLMYLLPTDLARCLENIYSLLTSPGHFVCTYPTVSEHRAPNPEAVELTPTELHVAFESVGFQQDLMVPVAPLVPQEVVDQSEAPDTRDEARRKYESAKADMTIDTSYHFLCRVSK